MSVLSYLYEGAEDHSFIFSVVAFFLLRYGLRWFLGISRIRRDQRNYADMMESHNSLLERQNQMLERHSALLDRIGKKYL